MENLEILNKETYKQIKNYLNKININMSEINIIANSNLCYIVSDYCNNKINVIEIIKMYDYITDVLQGKYPNLVINVSKEDRIIWAEKIIINNNKYGLTENEIEFFAFCIVYSFFVYTINENTQKLEQSIYDFTSKKRIVAEYEKTKKEKIWEFEIKECSSLEKEDYGYTIENPIEVINVSMEYIYLDSIVTSDNKEIFYNRVGSFNGKNDIFVDGYDIFIKKLFGKKKIATLYISCNGSKNSKGAPNGFKFKK